MLRAGGALGQHQVTQLRRAVPDPHFNLVRQLQSEYAQDAAWAADILAAQVTYAAIEAELRRTDPSALAAEITAHFARLPADDFPLITAHAAQLVAGDAGEQALPISPLRKE